MLGLPTELVTMILELLVHDENSLRHICLVGSRSLLALARPLTWRHIRIVYNVGHEPLACSTYGEDTPVMQETCFRREECMPHRLVRFSSDPRKASSVFSLSLRLKGECATDLPLFRALQLSLPKLPNASSLYIDFFELGSDCDGHDTLVRLLVESMPSLRCLRIDGGDTEYSIIKQNSQDALPPNLTRVQCRFTDPDMFTLLCHAPGLDDVTIECGDGRSWWRSHFPDGEAYRGYEGNFLPLTELFHGSWCDQYRRLVFVAPPSDEIFHSHLSLPGQFYTTAPDNYCIPDYSFLPNLTTLALWGFQMEVADIKGVLSSLCRPNMVSLKLSVKLHTTAADIIDGLQGLAGDLSRLTSLQDLWLPLEGLDTVHAHALCGPISQIPRLVRLYFDRPSTWTNAALLDTARIYRDHLPSIDAVSWEDAGIVSLSRPATGFHDVCPYRVPGWAAAIEE